MVTCLKWDATFHRIPVFMFEVIIGLSVKLPVFFALSVSYGDAPLGIFDYLFKCCRSTSFIIRYSFPFPLATAIITAISVIGYNRIYCPI